ncbi:MAG: hypothetical protein LBK99_05185 [Opitutaceae bacterium]|jgi:hypothetical protein|nr:hypothetical protein [Opitutaceae bacterium]
MPKKTINPLHEENARRSARHLFNRLEIERLAAQRGQTPRELRRYLREHRLGILNGKIVPVCRQTKEEREWHTTQRVFRAREVALETLIRGRDAKRKAKLKTDSERIAKALETLP